MDTTEFLKAIDSGALGHAYCFTGSEEWYKHEAVRRLREKLLPAGLEGFNEATLDHPTLREVLDAADTLPVMCDKRLVVARDWPPLAQGRDKADEAELEALSSWLSEPIDTSVTIFFNHGSVSNKALLKAFEAAGAVVTFDELSDREIAVWANRRLKPDGKKIDTDAVFALTERIGSDLTRLSIELDKLTAFVGDRPQIERRDVEAIVPLSLEQRVYTLTGYLLEGDIAQANVLLDSLIANGEDPMGILAFLTGQVRQLCHVRLALDANRPLKELVKPLGLRNEKALFPISKRSRMLPGRVFRDLYLRLVNMDYGVKSGTMRDIEAVSMAMLAIGNTARQKNDRRA